LLNLDRAQLARLGEALDAQRRRRDMSKRTRAATPEYWGLHGITNGGDESRAGWLRELTATVTAWARHVLGDKRWGCVGRELLYASKLSQLAADLPDAVESMALVGDALDYAQDVFTYARHREAILDHVEAQILAGPSGLPLVAHSLGSVVSVDLLTRWIRRGLFAGSNPDRWPVRGLITIGSPLGIDVPLPGGGLGFTDRAETLEALAFDMPRRWRWFNLVDASDPVVQGDITGAVLSREPPNLEDFSGYARLGVDQLAPIECGGVLTAHGGYWGDNATAQAVLDIWSV